MPLTGLKTEDGRQIWTCDNCQRTEPWNDEWGYYGSINDAEQRGFRADSPNPVPVACSRDCMAELLEKQPHRFPRGTKAIEDVGGDGRRKPRKDRAALDHPRPARAASRQKPRRQEKPAAVAPAEDHEPSAAGRELERLRRVEAAAAKVADWLERLAVQAEQQAKTTERDFPALAAACLHDARQRRIAVRDLRAAMKGEG